MYSINPDNITNYEMSDLDLQGFILFAIAVVNKTAKGTKEKLEKFLEYAHDIEEAEDHFSAILNIRKRETIFEAVERFKFGNHKMKAAGFEAIAQSGFDLRTCSIEDLESIPGIAEKTSRFFILHSRKDAQVACLDTHIKKWMELQGFEIPKNLKGRNYLKLEAEFLKLASSSGMSPAELDLKIWLQYRKG